MRFLVLKEREVNYTIDKCNIKITETNPFNKYSFEEIIDILQLINNKLFMKIDFTKYSKNYGNCYYCMNNFSLSYTCDCYYEDERGDLRGSCECDYYEVSPKFTSSCECYFSNNYFTDIEISDFLAFIDENLLNIFNNINYSNCSKNNYDLNYIEIKKSHMEHINSNLRDFIANKVSDYNKKYKAQSLENRTIELKKQINKEIQEKTKFK